MKKFVGFAATAALGAAVLVPAASASAAPADITGASLTWKVSECAFTGAFVTTAKPDTDSCLSIRETQGLDGGVTREAEGWRFSGGTGTFDHETGATSLAFTGSVQLGNTTRGGYAIRVADPKVTVAADGSGSVSGTVTYKTSAAGAETTVPDVALVDLAGVPDATSWTVTPPWTGVGAPASPAPLDGKQFAQPLLTTLPPSLQGWFWALTSAEATGSRGEYNSHKAPAPVTVQFVAPTPEEPTPTATPTPTVVPAPTPTATPAPTTASPAPSATSEAMTPKLEIVGSPQPRVGATATVTVKGTGFDPAVKRGPVTGVYVVFGPDAASTPNGYQNTELYADARYLPTAPDANGEFTTQLTVKGTYTDGAGKTWNGLTDTLGVSTWAAHAHTTTAYDAFTKINFRPAAKIAATTKLKLIDGDVVPGERAKIRVKVATDGTPTGELRVRAGKKGKKLVRTVQLRKSDDGVRRIKLPSWRKPGDKEVRAIFVGNDTTKRAESKTRELEVTKPLR